MNLEEQELMQIKSADFYVEEAVRLLKEYNDCKTEYHKVKYIPRLQYVYSKLIFEKQQLEKMFNV